MVVALLVFSLAPSARAQRLSSVFDVFASNSLINRPSIFRTMQNNIGDEIDKVRPGLKVDILTDRMAALREHVMTPLRKLAFGVDASTSPSRLTFDGVGETVTFSIGELAQLDNLATSYSTKPQVLKKQLSALILRGLNAFIKDDVPSALAKGLLAAGPTLGLPDLSSGITGTITQEAIADKLAESVLNYIATEIDRRVQEKLGISIATLTGASPPTVDLKELVTILNGGLATVVEKVGEGLNTGEQTVNAAVKEFSTALISANTGLAVTEGAKGDFAGGIHLSFNLNDMFQAGAYFNSHMTIDSASEADSGRAGRWLVGGQLRFMMDNSQLDLVGSLYPNRKGKLALNNSQFELGLGISHLVDNWQTVIGFGALFMLGTDNQSGIDGNGRTAVGLTVRRGDRDSPTLLVGYVWELEKDPNAEGSRVRRRTPVVKLTYPINPQ